MGLFTSIHVRTRRLGIGDWGLTVVHTQVHPQWAAKQRYSIGNIFPKALHASSTAKTNKTLEPWNPTHRQRLAKESGMTLGVNRAEQYCMRTAPGRLKREEGRGKMERWKDGRSKSGVTGHRADLNPSRTFSCTVVLGTFCYSNRY